MYSMVRNPNANSGDPQMSRIILYVAASLDGFIARPDGDVSWLDAYQAEGEDYGYRDFLTGVDAIAGGIEKLRADPLVRGVAVRGDPVLCLHEA